MQPEGAVRLKGRRESALASLAGQRSSLKMMRFSSVQMQMHAVGEAERGV